MLYVMKVFQRCFYTHLNNLQEGDFFPQMGKENVGVFTVLSYSLQACH